MGNAQGRSGRAHSGPGGLESQRDAAAGPTREDLSLQSALTRGEIVTNDDVPNKTAELAIWPASDGQLARFMANLAQSAPATYPVLSPSALGVAGGFVERVWIRPLSIVSPVADPEISLGTAGPNYENVIPQTAVAGAAGSVFLIEPAAGANLAYVAAGAVLNMQLRVVATATLYLVEVLVEGKIQRT